MKIYCGNDECKCAIEQILLNMFPTEKVEFSCGKAYGDSYVCADVKEGKVYTVARVVIVRDGKKECANARIINNHEDLKDRDRAYRSLIKVAFYKAARRILNKDNPWGAMTGIRPAKFAEMEILKHSAAHTEKYLKERFFVSDDRIHMCMEVAKKSIEIRKEHTDRDASIYIGIPFCPTRCAYCSFISNAISKNEKLMDRYVQCLKDEIINTAKTVKELNLDVKSVYFGGGTPTTLDAKTLEQLIVLTRECFNVSDDVEFTVEAGRPDTVTYDKLLSLYNNGVNRISINPQTMSDDVLKAIGRNHTTVQTVDAYKLARKFDFKTINMDLIAGLPSDTLEGFMNSLDEVISFRPENITVHTLALKKGARLFDKGVEIPSDAEVSQMLNYACKKLYEAGYAPYYLYRQKYMSGSFENIGWALPGHDGMYNIYIMEEIHTIIAMGAGASTKMVCAQNGRIERIFNPKYPYEYINMQDKIISSKEKIPQFYDDMKGDLVCHTN